MSYKALSSLLKILSNPSRLEIIDLLSCGSYTLVTRALPILPVNIKSSYEVTSGVPTCHAKKRR